MKTNMREILFRAKSIKTGKWLYGFYYQMTFGPNDELRHFLVLTPLGTGEDRIDPKTLGQFTGLKDKNGAKIFEGDILKFDDGSTAMVSWHETGWEPFQDHYCGISFNGSGDSPSDCEIIGIIHDNPKLLKGGEV